MPIPIILPKFGFTVETSTIVQWLKKDGDTVRSGDPICEVTTDKVNMEVEAPEAGTLIAPQFSEGADVPVTQVIAYLLRPGEARPDVLPGQNTSNNQSMPASIVVADSPSPSTEREQGGEANAPITPLARRMAEATNVDLTRVQGTGPDGRIMRGDVESALAQNANGAPGKVRATPAARHLAEQSGVALSAITGTGPKGRIQGTDVQQAIEARKQIISLPQPTPAAPQGESRGLAATDPGAPKIVKMAGMRRTIAIRLQQSSQQAPHIFFDAQIDMSGIEALRGRVKARKEKLSVTAILVKACAWTLLQHPNVNATLEGDEISLWPTANIGVAVALDEGLVVPVVHHAERLSIRDIQTTVDELAHRARGNTLHINDMQGGTFTISNLGMYGVDRFTAIINPPQVAILAVGRAIQQFVPDAAGQPVLRSLMTVTLSADHRVVDGAHAAHFLGDLRTVLEEPALMAW